MPRCSSRPHPSGSPRMPPSTSLSTSPGPQPTLPILPSYSSKQILNMQINAIITSIYEADNESKVELIGLLEQETPNKVIGDPARLFVLVKSLLVETDAQIIMASHSLMRQFFRHLLPNECHNLFATTAQELITNLADAQTAVRKSTKAVFLGFIKRTRNLEFVAQQLCSFGFDHKNFYVRERAINLVPDVLLAGKEIFFSRNGINDARKLIENVVVHLADRNTSVQDQARKVCRKLKQANFENFEKAFVRLSQEHQRAFNLVEMDKVQQEQKFIKINLDELAQDQDFIKIDAVKEQMNEFFLNRGKADEDMEEWNSVRGIYKQFLTSEIQPGMKPEDILKLFPQDLDTKLYFGFLRGDILQDTFNERDKRVREYGIKCLNDLFFEQAEEAEEVETSWIFQGKVSKAVETVEKKGFLPQFFKYVSYLLSAENNEKMVHVLLNIVYKTMAVPGVHVNTYLALCLPGLVKCLNDGRVVIRRKAVYLMRLLIKYLKPRQYLINLLFFLDDAKGSWHVKEELLNMISILVLEVRHGIEINFQKVLIRISYFLDDKVAKVRQAAMECLAVLCNSDKHQQQFTSILHEVLDQKVYSLLIDKLETGRVYFLNAQGNLELPQIDIKQLERRKREFEKQQKEFEEQQRLRQEKEKEKEEKEEPEFPKLGEVVAEEIEESDESHYKISYYERPGRSKYPISMRDRILKSNESFDKLFVSEHNQIDASKQDILVSSKQVKSFDGKIDPLSQKLYVFNEVEDKYWKEFVMEDENEEVMPDDEEDNPQAEEMQIPKDPLKFRGHPPERRQIVSKVDVNEDIQKRVGNTIKQLNEDKNVDMQIPKVIKANVAAYERYEYKEQNEDEDLIIFLDTKKIKEEIKANKNDKDQQDNEFIVPQKETKFEVPQQMQKLQEIIVKQEDVFNEEQKYQKRLNEFLLTFEDPDSKQGRNARKIKKKLKSEAVVIKDVDLSKPLQNPIAEVNALIINLSSIKFQLTLDSLTKFRILLKHHLDIVYSSQVPLVQMISDVARLLSTQHDNPLYRSGLTPDDMRIIAVHAMRTISDIIKYLKRTTDPAVKYMFQQVGVWLNDTDTSIITQAEQTMLDILNYGDDSQFTSILPKLYDRKNFHKKIHLGVLLEELVNKWQYEIFRSPHFTQMIHIISWMLTDTSFDVRRQSKKVYFKILSLCSDLDQLERIIDSLHYYEAQQMRELLIKHNQLEKDYQIGIKYHRFNQQPPKQQRFDDPILTRISFSSKNDSMQPAIQDLKQYRLFDIEDN